MTFWQGLCISVLAQTTDVAGNDKAEWATSAQNFLICLEMLLFSIAHFYCFPTEEWQEGYRLKVERSQFGDTIALGDFFQDVKLILTSRASSTHNDQHSVRRRRRKSSAVGNSTRSVFSADSVSSPVRSLRKGTSVKSARGGAPKSSKRVSKEEARQSTVSESDITSTVKEKKDSESQSEVKGRVNSTTENSLEEEKVTVKEEQAMGIASPSTTAMKDTAETGKQEHSVIDEESHDSGDDDDYEYDDDEEDGYTDTTLEDLNDDQQFVKMALKRSLGAAGDDPEVKEATKRLLESKILSPEFFLGNDASIEIPAGFSHVFGLHSEGVADYEGDSSCHDYEDDGEDDGKEEAYEESVDEGNEVFEDATELPLDEVVKNDARIANERDALVTLGAEDESKQAAGESGRKMNTGYGSITSHDNSSNIQEGSIETPVKLTSNHVHEGKSSNEEYSPDERTPPRAYQQKGLEFLLPDSDTAEDHLRPSFFTTVAQIGESTKNTTKSRDHEEDSL